MIKYMAIGCGDTYVFEAKDWDEAVYMATEYFGENGLVSIIKLPEEDK